LASVVLAGGAFITGIAIYFGASDFQIAMLAAIPSLTQVIQIVAAFIIDTTGWRKGITIYSLLISRLLLFGIAFLAFFKGNWSLSLLLILYLLNYISLMSGAAGAISWFADLVPARIRGRFFASRNTAIALSTVLAVIFGGFLLDKFRSAGSEEYGYFALFSLAGILGLVSIVLLRKLPNVIIQKIDENLNFEYFFEPLRDKSFLKILIVFVSWNFALGISAPFFNPHMLTNLRMSFTLVSLYSAGGAIMAVIFNRPWGKIIDRFGCKPVAIVTAFAISLIPFVWFFPRHDFLSVLIFESIYSGIFWAGFNISAFNIPIAYSPVKKRTKYIAIFSVMSGLALFLGSITAGLLSQEWSNVRIPWGKQTIVNYHLIFALSGTLRFLSAFFMLSFQEPHEKQTPEVLQYIGHSMVRWFSQGRQVFDIFLKRLDIFNNDDDEFGNKP